MGDLSAEERQSVLPVLMQLRDQGYMSSSWEEFHARLLGEFGVQQESDSPVLQKLSEEVTGSSGGDYLAKVRSLTDQWEGEQSPQGGTEQSSGPGQYAATGAEQDLGGLPTDQQLPDPSEVVQAIVAEVTAAVVAAMADQPELASYPELEHWVAEFVEAELSRLAGLEV